MEKKEIVRPTKKQQFLLEFITKFIEGHGYGPSYREIMTGCNYNSVATVALHINNLISRGHLQKNGRSARSLEIINAPKSNRKLPTNEINPTEEKWLVEKVDFYFKKVENDPKVDDKNLEELSILINALKVLGVDGAANNFNARILELKKRAD